MLHISCPACSASFGCRGTREAHVPDHTPYRSTAVSSTVSAPAFTPTTVASAATVTKPTATFALALAARSSAAARAALLAAGSAGAGAKPTTTG